LVSISETDYRGRIFGRASCNAAQAVISRENEQFLRGEGGRRWAAKGAGGVREDCKKRNRYQIWRVGVTIHTAMKKEPR
jgi:hypothetical protein